MINLQDELIISNNGQGMYEITKKVYDWKDSLENIYYEKIQNVYQNYKHIDRESEI